MNRESIPEGLSKGGMRIGSCEYYPLGNVTLDQLKHAKIIPDTDYKKYSQIKPSALLVDRRKIDKIRVIVVIQCKSKARFNSQADTKRATEQCNDLCHVLGADIGVVTDYYSYIWIDPNQKDKGNEYMDKRTKKRRSYTVTQNTNGKEFIREFLNVVIQGG